jgi:hypothetical protein
MTQPVLWDALGPVSARTTKVVREHEILRVAASILGKDPAKLAEVARREVLAWAQRRSGGRLPEDAWTLRSFEYFSGGRNSIGERIEGDVTDIWAIRADDPDKSIAGRVWTTEVVVGLQNNLPPRFSARLLVSTPEEELKIEPHTPGLMQQVIEKCGLWRESIKLDTSPRIIESTEDAESLADMLVDQQRKLPIFVLTVSEAAADPVRPLLDASALTRAMLGIGLVFVLPAAFTWSLTDRFGKQLSVFGGAVRAYLPGFAEDTNPYDHRLALADHISTPDGAAQCMRWMRSMAATESIRRTRLGNDVLAFAAIRNASLRIKQKRLEQEGASDSERLETANARIVALEKQILDEGVSLEYFSNEHKKAEERAESAESQARASAFYIQKLIGQIKGSGEVADAAIQLPNSWEEFSSWCDLNLGGRVVLGSAARRNVKAPEFEDLKLAARCLLWLANTGRDRRMHGGEGSLGDEVIESGIRNAHCGADQFDLTWQGRQHTADWHIKNGGNTRAPKRCLRIYYFWDTVTEQLVIADMPAHRHTGAT